MQIVRLHDPGRRPVSWTDIIRDGQFAVFAKLAASGVPCDADGVRFATPNAATCAIFDALTEARSFCEAAVVQHPEVCFDIFDAAGRARPPLLMVLDPSRAAALETSPQQMQRRRRIAWGLIVGGLPLLGYAAIAPVERDIILPIFFGINGVLWGGRMLWMNLALRETERDREARLQAASGDRTRTS